MLSLPHLDRLVSTSVTSKRGQAFTPSHRVTRHSACRDDARSIREGNMGSQPAHGQSDTDREIMCPSAPPTEGALLLSITRPNGTIAYVRSRIPVTADFLSDAGSDSVDQRFRFASPCQESDCAQWSGSECSIPARVAGIMPPVSDADIPHCSIRVSCRWYSQSGFAACRVCPLIVRTTAQSEAG